MKLDPRFVKVGTGCVEIARDGKTYAVINGATSRVSPDIAIAYTVFASKALEQLDGPSGTYLGKNGDHVRAMIRNGRSQIIDGGRVVVDNKPEDRTRYEIVDGG